MIDDDRRCLDCRLMSIKSTMIDEGRELLSMSIKSIKVEKNVYINFELDALLTSCSTYFNYLVIAFIVEAYVISYWPSYDCLWQTSSLEQNPSHLCTLENDDLTTLNTLRMFTSRQRNLVLNIISVTTLKINSHFDN